MDLTVLVAGSVVFLAAAYILARRSGLPSLADMWILIASTETDSKVSRLRRDTGNRNAFESIYADRDDPWESFRASYGYQQRKYQTLLSFLPGDRRFGRVLDIGCGLGALSRPLADRADHVLGLDLAQSAVDRARIRHADAANMEFAQGDVFDLPAELNGTFDLVILVDVLYYAPDTSAQAYQAVAARIAALLRPGGICVICNHYFAWILDKPTRRANRIHGAFRQEPQFGAVTEHWRPFYLTTLLTKAAAPQTAATMPVSAKGKYLVASLTGLVFIALVAWFGARQIGSEVLRALWAVPVILAIHLFQLFLSSMAWQRLSPGLAQSNFAIFRLRWMREGINSLLPVAQIGGFIVNIRLLVQRGALAASAAAGAILDLWAEAVAQAVFILASLVILGVERPSSSMNDWAGGGFVLLVLGLITMVLMHKYGALRKLENWAVQRASSIAFLPVEAMRGLDDELRARLAHPQRTLVAIVLHLLAWMLGTAEVYLVLTAIGANIAVPQAFVIEALGTAARSSGFAVPAGLGVQEGGYILACGLFGIPPDAGIALSMVKRLREILVGVPGLLMWQREELRNRFVSKAHDA